MARPKSYEHKKEKALRKNSAFLIDRLRTEWDAIEKGARYEQRVRQAKESSKVVGKGLLTLLAIAGVVTIVAVAPNMFAAVGKIKGRKKFVEKQPLRDTLQRLRKNGHISVESDADRYTIKLTEDGADTMLAQSLNDLRVRHPDRWDGQWRFVFFDIPNRHKWARDAFRQQLNVMGFYRMQESVFVHPFPCDEEMHFLVDMFGIGDYVRFFTAHECPEDGDIREFFVL